MTGKLIPVIILAITIQLYAGITADGSIPADKKLHLEAGLVIGAGAYFIGPGLERIIYDESCIHPLFWSIGMAAAAGAGKEVIYDDMMGRGLPERKDFYYTVAGGAISGVTLTVIELIFDRRADGLALQICPGNRETEISFTRKF